MPELKCFRRIIVSKGEVAASTQTYTITSIIGVNLFGKPIYRLIGKGYAATVTTGFIWTADSKVLDPPIELDNQTDLFSEGFVQIDASNVGAMNTGAELFYLWEASTRERKPFWRLEGIFFANRQLSIQ